MMTEITNGLREIEDRITSYCDQQGWRIESGHMWSWDGEGSRYCDLCESDDVYISIRVSDHSPTGSGSPCDVYIYPSDLDCWDGAIDRINSEMNFARLDAEA